MRLALLVAGLLVTLMGLGWALQGAYLLPATFMRGPEWIAIGAAVAAVGLVLVWRATRKGVPPQPDTVTSTES